MATDTGGWWGLLSILQEREIVKRQLHSKRPTACPNDGEPLRSGPRGSPGLYCPYDGWKWPERAEEAIL